MLRYCGLNLRDLISQALVGYRHAEFRVFTQQRLGADARTGVLKRFGYLAGVARGCVVEAQRIELEREAVRELRKCQTRECARREIREHCRNRYYRGSDRWYRDGRYWDRYEYERRYYRRHDDDMLKGALVGAAVVGVAVAIAHSEDD
jgi:hypothetical protein